MSTSQVRLQVAAPKAVSRSIPRLPIGQRTASRKREITKKNRALKTRRPALRTKEGENDIARHLCRELGVISHSAFPSYETAVALRSDRNASSCPSLPLPTLSQRHKSLSLTPHFIKTVHCSHLPRALPLIKAQSSRLRTSVRQRQRGTCSNFIPPRALLLLKIYGPGT